MRPPLSPENAMSFILHQDNLMWSRIQTMAVIQVAAVGAAYALRPTPSLSIGVLILALVLTFLVFGLLRRDELQRSKVHETLEALNWSVPRSWYSPLRGGETTWVIFFLLVGVDVLLGILILSGIV